MKMIYKRQDNEAELWVGSEEDFETHSMVNYFEGWAVIHACKEPYHRRLLGYETKAAPKDHPEYLFAERGDTLYLNLIDAPLPEYIPDEIIDKALDFIQVNMDQGKNVFVHCNWGESRAPGIALLWMVKNHHISGNVGGIWHYFKDNLYPDFKPRDGMALYIKRKILEAGNSGGELRQGVNQ